MPWKPANFPQGITPAHRKNRLREPGHERQQKPALCAPDVPHALAGRSLPSRCTWTAEPHGGVEEQRTFTYLTFMIANLGLKNHVFFEKNVPRDRMNDWLEDKDCLISASIFESFGLQHRRSHVQGHQAHHQQLLGRGIFSFPKQYIANTLDDVRRIYATPADPEALRAFIEKRHSPRRLPPRPKACCSGSLRKEPSKGDRTVGRCRTERLCGCIFLGG